MIQVIVAAHGKLAAELVNSSEMVFGEVEGLHGVTFVPGEGQDTLVEKYEAIIAECSPSDSVLFLVDLFGGSPYNAAARVAAKRPQDDIVTGVSLPMLLEVLDAKDDAKSAEALADIAKEVGVMAVKSYRKPDDVASFVQPETPKEEAKEEKQEKKEKDKENTKEDKKEEQLPTCDGISITSNCIFDGITYSKYIYHPAKEAVTHVENVQTGTETRTSSPYILCNDGFHWGSMKHRGACSGHNGVADFEHVDTYEIPVYQEQIVEDSPAQDEYYEKEEKQKE